MLKPYKNLSKRRKSELRITPGEAARDAALNVGVKAAQESAYAIGNSTDKLIAATEQLNNAASVVTGNAAEVASNVKDVADKITGVAKSVEPVFERGVELVFGSESASSIGRVAFKASKDIARGDTVCTGLCLVSGACETVALCCSTIKGIPCRSRIYVGAKVISRGCITYRNMCAGEGC